MARIAQSSRHGVALCFFIKFTLYELSQGLQCLLCILPFSIQCKRVALNSTELQDAQDTFSIGSLLSTAYRHKHLHMVVSVKAKGEMDRKSTLASDLLLHPP